MESFAAEFEIRTQGEGDAVDLTKKVNEVVRRSGFREGLAFIFARHSTGAILVNQFESNLISDIKAFFDRLVPSDNEYHHPYNSFAHIKSILMEPSKVVPFRAGHLDLGPWQNLVWFEVDPRARSRSITVTLLGSKLAEYGRS